MFTHNKKRFSEVCLVGLLKPLGKKRSFNNTKTMLIPLRNPYSAITTKFRSLICFDIVYKSIFEKLSRWSHRSCNNDQSVQKQQEQREASRRKQQNVKRNKTIRRRE
ncbi:hypothetical protein SSS_02500, partial [Sarcoptes scabiei]